MIFVKTQSVYLMWIEISVPSHFIVLWSWLQYFLFFFSFFKAMLATTAGKAQSRDMTAKHRELCRVLRKGKMKKCGILNSNGIEKKKADFFS